MTDELLVTLEADVKKLWADQKYIHLQGDNLYAYEDLIFLSENHGSYNQGGFDAG